MVEAGPIVHGQIPPCMACLTVRDPEKSYIELEKQCFKILSVIQSERANNYIYRFPKQIQNKCPQVLFSSLWIFNFHSFFINHICGNTVVSIKPNEKNLLKLPRKRYEAKYGKLCSFAISFSHARLSRRACAEAFCFATSVRILENGETRNIIR